MFLYPNRSGIPSAFITQACDQSGQPVLWILRKWILILKLNIDYCHVAYFRASGPPSAHVNLKLWTFISCLYVCTFTRETQYKVAVTHLCFVKIGPIASDIWVKFWLCIVPRCHTRVNRQGQWRYISMMMVVAVVVLMMVAVVLVVVTMKTMLVMITRTTQSRLRHHGVVVYLLTVGSRFANSYIVRYVDITPSFLPIYLYVVYAWFSQVAHRSGSLCFWIWFYWVSSSVLLIWIKALAMALFFSILFSLNISAYLIVSLILFIFWQSWTTCSCVSSASLQNLYLCFSWPFL